MRCTPAWIITVLLIATAALSAQAQLRPVPPATTPAPPVAEKVDAAVEQLIKDLGSDDYRTREKAGRELTARGEKVLPSLRTALSTTDDPEVQRRLLVMVRKMDYDRLVTPKRIKMSLKDKTAKEALAEISRQTGYKVEYMENGRASESKYNFEFDNLPFWQAVDKVATTAGCVAFNDYNDDSIQVSNQDSTNPYVAYAGPFRFLATNINSNKNVQLSGINRRGGGVSRQEYLNLNFQIQSEPKNPMLGITQVDVITATDEFGGSLIPPKDPNNRVNFYNNPVSFRGHNLYGAVNLGRSDKTATTMKTLKAKVGVILLSGTVPEIVVTDPLKVQNKTFSGRTVEVEFGTLTERPNVKGHYQLDLTIKKLSTGDPADRGEDFNWMNNVWQKIEVVDSAGNRYHTYGANNFNNNGSAVQLTIPFDPNDRRTGQPMKLGPPAKVLINEWLSVVHEVTFEFKDVPLP